jgi:hypothetical protein
VNWQKCVRKAGDLVGMFVSSQIPDLRHSGLARKGFGVCSESAGHLAPQERPSTSPPVKPLGSDRPMADRGGGQDMKPATTGSAAKGARS